ADARSRFGAGPGIPRRGVARRLRSARARGTQGARANARAGSGRRPRRAALGEHAQRASEGGPAVIALLRQWWLGLSRRERIGTAGAASFVLAALLFLVAIEPAWRTRERLAGDLPRLRAEAAQMEALRLEARRLKERGLRFDN